MKTYVNLGCGARYHPEWTNFDIVPQGPGVIQADLSQGIPLSKGTADVVYHSAVLEHIRREHVVPFLRECHRVLKPGGVIRIAVPDLEGICRLYLEKLQAARGGGAAAAPDYDWMLLELLDQCVRERSGGDMMQFFRRPVLANESFVLDRIGEEGRAIIRKIRGASPVQAGVVARLWRLLRRSRRALQLLPRGAVGLLLGATGRQALRVGYFRLGGEVHQWMYDDYSLARLLTEAGFVQPQRQTAGTSQVPEWSDFHLDTLPDGTIAKPDLFYMEATKPCG